MTKAKREEKQQVVVRIHSPWPNLAGLVLVYWQRFSQHIDPLLYSTMTSQNYKYAESLREWKQQSRMSSEGIAGTISCPHTGVIPKSRRFCTHHVQHLTLSVISISVCYRLICRCDRKGIDANHPVCIENCPVLVSFILVRGLLSVLYFQQRLNSPLRR